MINLVLIDDHVMIHDAVRFQLAGLSDIVLVGTGAAGEEIEPLIERYQPDVMLIDLSIHRLWKPVCVRRGAIRCCPLSDACESNTSPQSS